MGETIPKTQPRWQHKPASQTQTSNTPERLVARLAIVSSVLYQIASCGKIYCLVSYSHANPHLQPA